MPNPFTQLQQRQGPDGQEYLGQGYFLAPDKSPINLTANQVTPVTMRVDFDYALTAIVGHSTGDYLLQIQDESGYTISNNPIHSSLLVGTAERPHYLNPFFQFHRNQTIVMTFTDLSGAANSIYLAFETVRLMPRG